MSEIVLRRMAAADMSAVLAVQAQCYGSALLESADALASRLALSPDTCWVAALPGGHLAAYLFTHPWPTSTLPPFDDVLMAHWPASAPLTWFVHDMAVAPVGRGAGLAARLYDAARDTALAMGLASSRLIAVQSAAAWWRRLGYAPLPAIEAAPHAAKLAAYGVDAVLMERRLPG
ncbi:Ribosomal protein S18 acetylase RimI [Cupriavidus sp. YR651]|uniref:GNAT family N-acetyltransferase n=1 Tax=Cupriavidus sp. YR651 TaxID=1855315 RepID=UPI00088D6903|nr:GNAT family N-acetyltransferase [Cupriavidus sp. YR651]SDD67894.1 Ribosomal protein S18 acetylase RimI [Cupriavidus sp. YR651]